MSSENFDTKFLGDFNSRFIKGEEPGSAKLSLIEIKSLKKLLSTVGNKEEARQVIIEHGFPLLKSEIGPEDLGETAYSHLCVVAAWLNKERGSEVSSDTVESYITKNRFDRYVQMKLIKSGKIHGHLGEEWSNPISREPGYENKDQVQYPKGVDDTKIYGVAKPNRYLPAQLVRYLEYARLGKITDIQTREKLGLNRGEEDKYKIEWDNYDDIIVEADSVDDIASGVAARAMIKMKENGLTDDQIIKMIIIGYNPAGVMNEHGDIPDIHNIWSKLINKAQETTGLENISSQLAGEVDRKMKKQNSNYEFQLKTEI